MRKILKNHFNFEMPKKEVNSRLKRKFTTVKNPDLGDLLSNYKQKNKIFTSKGLSIVDKKFGFDLNTKSENGNVDCNNNNSNKKNNFVKNKFLKNVSVSKLIKMASRKNSSEIYNTDVCLNVNEKENIIEIDKLEEIQKYVELEKKKIDMLFIFYDTFVNINIKIDYSNILNGYEVLNKNRKLSNPNNLNYISPITDFTIDLKDKVENRSPIIKKKKKQEPKYSEHMFSFFENIKIYKEANPDKISKQDLCGSPGVISYIGFDYTIFLTNDSREQIFILDTLLLNILGVLNLNISNKILQILLIKNNCNKNSKENINKKKSIRNALALNKSLGLGLVYILIENLILSPKLNNLNHPECLNNFRNMMEVRKINRLALNVNLLKSLSIGFQSNFLSVSNFDKRKLSLFSYIKSIDKQLNIFKDLLVINQHFYDSIIFMKIEDQIIEEDQFSYRVFLEFRNFLFQYQDKNILSPKKKLFKSLADKQLLEYSSRIMANKFYFWKPNISINFKDDQDNNKNSMLNNVLSPSTVSINGDKPRSNSNNILKNLSIKNQLNPEDNISTNKMKIIKFDNETIDRINSLINPDESEKINFNSNTSVNAIANANTNAYINVNAKTNTNAYANTNVNTNTNGYANPNTNANANTNTNAYANANVNTNTNGYANPNNNIDFTESSFYQFYNQIEIINSKVFNKIKNLKPNNFNFNNNTDKKNNTSNNFNNINNLKLVSFKSNSIQNNVNENNISNNSKNLKVNGVFDVKHVNLISSNNLIDESKSIKKIEILSDIEQSNENSNIKKKNILTDNFSSNINLDSITNFDNNSQLNKSSNIISKKFEIKPNLIKEKSSQLDHITATNFLKKTIREISNNHNKIQSNSPNISIKQSIKPKEFLLKEFSSTQTNFNSQNNNSKFNLNSLGEFGLSNNSAKNNNLKKENFNKTGYTFFQQQKLNNFNDKNDNNLYNFSKCIGRNNYESNKMDILLPNTNLSESGDSNDESYILPYNLFYTRCIDNKNPIKQVRKMNIIDINGGNEFILKNTSAKDFLVRKKIILNRNKLKSFSTKKYK